MNLVNKDYLIKSCMIQGSSSGLLNPYSECAYTFGVKDVFDIKGTVTSWGNPTWASRQNEASSNAACVDILLAAGGICVGKLSLGEFSFGTSGANEFYGMPVNPRYPELIPGGSSSGSAVAVASGDVDFSIATDFAGSVRVPASFCGVYGMKTTQRLFPLIGTRSAVPSFDSIGFFSSNLEVLKPILNTIMPDQGYNFNEIIVPDDFIKMCDPLIISEFNLFLSRLEKSTELKITHVLLSEKQGVLGSTKHKASDVLRGVLCYEINKSIGAWAHTNKFTYKKDTFVDFSVFDDVNVGADIYEYYQEKMVHEFVMNKFLGKDKIILMPTVPFIPFERDEAAKTTNEFDYEKLRPFIAISSVCNLPQLCVPLHNAYKVPMSISFISSSFTDLTLLNYVLTLSSDLQL